jgi:ribonuclease HIII
LFVSDSVRPMSAPINSFSFTLNGTQQQELIAYLKAGNFLPTPVPYSLYAARTRDCSIVVYKSGKCVVQGKGASDFVTFQMEPLILLKAELGYDEILNPEKSLPHMGVDESGKGDFFGPMVIAAAYTDETLTQGMTEIGVKDSKAISSDSRLIEIAGRLRRLLGPRRFTVIQINPTRYNQLYARIRNLNELLAWGHARSIENILEMIPDCPMAISDQFGNKSQVKKALMKRGSQIELVQRHKAESDLAVAAASILAREGFLRALHDLSIQYGMKIPKGASLAVQETADMLIKKHGPTILLQVAKCHFKTADVVLTKAGVLRAVLGPDGAVVSRPFSGRRKASSTPAANQE